LDTDLGRWIQIRMLNAVPNLDPGGQNDPKKLKETKKIEWLMFYFER
jgi:hypothetical protein